MRIIKVADEWADARKALDGYKQFLELLRENASKQVNEVLDDVETRAESGEDFDQVLQEYMSEKAFFKKWVESVAPENSGGSEESDGYSKGQELSGVDSEGNKVSGEYVRSVFGRPQIETSNGPVVLSEVD